MANVGGSINNLKFHEEADELKSFGTPAIDCFPVQVLPNKSDHRFSFFIGLFNYVSHSCHRHQNPDPRAFTLFSFLPHQNGKKSLLKGQKSFSLLFSWDGQNNILCNIKRASFLMELIWKTDNNEWVMKVAFIFHVLWEGGFFQRTTTSTWSPNSFPKCKCTHSASWLIPIFIRWVVSNKQSWCP